jgi:alpha-galactosidase
MITISADGPTFHLATRRYSYALGVLDGRFLAHLYWGAPLGGVAPEAAALVHPASPEYLAVQTTGYSLDTLPQEYPVAGTGEQRRGALEVTLADGTEALRLEYFEHEVTEGARVPAGLPALRSDHRLGPVQTLRVRLGDPRGDLTVDLHYVVAEESAALLRWTRVTNTSAGAVTLREAASASWDLPPGRYDMVSLAGAWARERHVVRSPLSAGRRSVGSRSGASSHQTSPFFAVCDPEADETVGQVRAAGLLYSGNFAAACDIDQYEACRASIGIAAYRDHLEPGESFETPVAALVHSETGFGGMSAAFHHLLREGIMASPRRGEPRKTVINSWEAMYFDISAEKIVSLARSGREIGAELLVLDDGWFSRRRDDTTSLGDWWVNRELFPEGLGPVAEAVRSEGLEFGLWIEPEMVSPESELYREHPEWCLQVPGREPTLARRQLTLDLANPAVVDHLFGTISAILTESSATYVKWDMNRAMTEAGSSSLPPERQGEVMHRSILGLYALLERLTAAFPGVLFEGCAGGGGRFDMGLARYSPRFWTSDQTDAVERLDVQYGTSLVFPPEMIGAHVSSVPNHQVGRTTPAWTRVLTAAAFSYGYELNPAGESAEDRAVFAAGSALYRRVRDVAITGRFVRLGNGSGSSGAVAPVAAGGSMGGSSGGRVGLTGETGGTRAWMVESADGGELYVFWFRPLVRSNELPGFLRLPVGGAPGTGGSDAASSDAAARSAVSSTAGPGSTGGAGRGGYAADLPAGQAHNIAAEPVYRDAATGRLYSAGQLRSRGLWLGAESGAIEGGGASGGETAETGAAVGMDEPAPAVNPRRGDYQARYWHLVREDA